jgi:hypothetical protein
VVPSNHGDATLFCDPASVKPPGFVHLQTVDLYRLDDVASEGLFQADKVMKVDVEGHELEVLRGAGDFLTRGAPPRAVYLEAFQLGDKKEPLVRFLVVLELDLRLARRLRDGPRPLRPRPLEGFHALLELVDVGTGNWCDAYWIVSMHTRSPPTPRTENPDVYTLRGSPSTTQSVPRKTAARGVPETLSQNKNG